VILEIEGEDKEVIEAEYEWMPPKCNNCTSFGHIEAQCPIKLWKPKDKSNPDIETTNTQTYQERRNQG